MPWRGPEHPGDFPTLGWQVIDWMIAYLAAPDRREYEPFVPTTEQVEFILGLYRLDPDGNRGLGKRAIRRALLSRPRGWGKSPLLAALCCVEALGPVVPDGWDADGEPVGMPWSEVRTPLVQVAAVSEKQTKNTWDPLLEMLREGPVVDTPGLEVLDTFVNLPKGKIEPITSSPTSVKGNKAVFACLDQTEEWTKSNGGMKLAKTMRFNAGKIGGCTVESPNAYTPRGEDAESVAQQSARFAKLIAEGRAKDDGFFHDHREAPPETDLADRESLIAGLAWAYGDSAKRPCVIHDPPCPPGWVDLDRLVGEVWDPSNDEQTSRADLLNQITHAGDAWLSEIEISARHRVGEVVADGTVITLGFDGSKGRAKRGVKPDATALVGCRVSDGHLFEIRCWEAPDGPAGEGWEPPIAQIEAEIDGAFGKWRVAGFFADPAKGWRSHVNAWEGRYMNRLVKAPDGRTVRARRDHPFEWWMTGGRVLEIVRATKRLRDAIVNGEITLTGAALLRHLANCRKRDSRVGTQVAKEHPTSPHKIDSAVCGILALEARDTAIAIGITGHEEPEMGGWTF
ncbi:hypothetical protein AB0I61_17295 [Polymorphospora rubra]|uniref:hypothetical protein n=1 Tax=Polymorphospora rubra TaxID=338584 RepID=UPI0033CD210F